MKLKVRNNKKAQEMIVIVILILILTVVAITTIGRKNQLISKDNQVKKAETEANNITEIEDESSIKFYYEVEEILEDKLKILIHVQDEEKGLSRIEFPDTDAIIVEQNKTQEKAIDYEIEYDKEYTFKIKSEDGEEKEEKILEKKVVKPVIKASTEWTNQAITVEVDYGATSQNAEKQISIDGGVIYSTYTGPVQVEKNTLVKARAIGISLQEESELKITNIDKIEPKEFTPTVSDLVSSTQLTIKANTIDGDATEEYGQSGIEQYQYYIYEGETLIDSSEKISKSSWIASGLTVGNTYDIYVEAYDRAGNFKKSEMFSHTKLEVYVWERYNALSTTTYTITSSRFTNSRIDPAYYHNYNYSDYNRNIGRWQIPSGKLSYLWVGGSNKIALNKYIGARGSTNSSGANTNRLRYIKNIIGETVQSGWMAYISGTEYKSVSQTVYSKGTTLVGTVTSNSTDTYPANGYQPYGAQEGYWYVRIY